MPEVRSQEWEPIPTYWEFFQDSLWFIKDSRSRHVPILEDDEETLKSAELGVSLQIKLAQCIFVIAGAVFWTEVRKFINKRLAEPIGRHFKLTKGRQYDLETNLWALVYNVSAWPFLFFTVYYQHELFQRPSIVWDDCCGSAPVPWDITLNYLIWSSYEVHLLYALYFIESMASDTLLYTVHHAVTLALLGMSWGLGYQRVGLLVLILLESTNIPLKAMKVLSSFRLQENREIPIVTKICTLFLYLFAASWILFRLYWYPLKAIYAAEHIPKRLQVPQQLSYQFSCVALLLFLLALNIFWFMLIVKLVWKVSTGKKQPKLRK